MFLKGVVTSIKAPSIKEQLWYLCLVCAFCPLSHLFALVQNFCKPRMSASSNEERPLTALQSVRSLLSSPRSLLFPGSKKRSNDEPANRERRTKPPNLGLRLRALTGLGSGPESTASPVTPTRSGHISSMSPSPGPSASPTSSARPTNKRSNGSKTPGSPTMPLRNIPTGIEVLMYGKHASLEYPNATEILTPTPWRRLGSGNAPGSRRNESQTASQNLGLLKRRATMFQFGASTKNVVMKKKQGLPQEYQDLLNMKELRTVVRPGNKNVFHCPAFKLRPYGKIWHRDNVVFFSNAVRYETRGLYFILYCLLERDPEELEAGDIESFFAWFNPYYDFITTVLSVLQTTFLPWIEAAGDVASIAPSIFFSNMYLSLQKNIRRAIRYEKKLLKLPPPEAAQKLHKLFFSYGKRLLIYFSKLEDAASAVLENAVLANKMSIDECRLMSRALIKEISTMPSFRKNLVLLLRWVDHLPETTALWKREHLDTRAAVLVKFWNRPRMEEECIDYFARKCKAVPQDLTVRR